MRTLFNLQSPVEYGILKSPSWAYVRDGLRRNLETILRYYRRNPTAVKSSHFLVRLLGSIALPHSMSLERFFSNVDAIALNTSMALKMTSSINKGVIHKGIFYGPDCDEVLVAHTTEFDIYEATKNWKNLSPVTVVRHPVSNLSMMIPDGYRRGTESGLAVILINVNMLAIMYRAFRREEDRLVPSGESQRSVYQFLRMYVLPNMLLSHIDVVMFNRMDNLVKGAPMGEAIRTHSFATVDYTKRVTDGEKEILKLLEGKRQDFVAQLKSIPGIIRDNMYDALVFPDMAPTRQVVWSEVLATLPVLAFLFRLSTQTPSTNNGTEVNKIRKALTTYRSEHYLEAMLPVDEYYAALQDIDLIMGRNVVEQAA